MAMINRGFDGLERLTQWRNAEWFQSYQFEILTTPVGWIGTTSHNTPPVYFKGAQKPHFDGFLTPTYNESLIFGIPGNIKATELEQAVDSCASTMFGVRLLKNQKNNYTAIRWSGQGNNGSIDFQVDTATIENRTGISDYGKNLQTFTVKNNATSYDNTQLGSAGKGRFGSSPFSGFSSQTFLGKTVFTTDTFTANNIQLLTAYSVSGAFGNADIYQATQIHEAGNALAKLTGKDYTAGDWKDPSSGITYHFGKPSGKVNDPLHKDWNDDDSGQAFEFCVMKKYRAALGLQVEGK
jgi:hypothetical protein